ncbi:Nucleolar complex protein 4, partial [Kappamyces sp. JEL0680]
MNERQNEFRNNIYKILVRGLLQLERISKPLAALVIQALNAYDDLRYYFFKNAAAFMELASSSVLVQILPKVKEGFVEDAASYYGETDYTGMQKQKGNSVLNSQSFRRVFSDCWLAFLGLDMTSSTYIAVLEVLHEKVIPFLSEPVALMDFLVDAYGSGGVVSILALHGIFTLIIDHNLDYPQFYPKLYALFDRNILHVKYRARFFRLASLFLASQGLPSYLVAAFIKRMVRLSIYSPPSGIMMVLPFVFNLFRLHPSCIKLIHSPDSTDATS